MKPVFKNFKSFGELRKKVAFDSDVNKDLKYLDGNLIRWLLSAIDNILDAPEQRGAPLRNAKESKLGTCRKVKNDKLGIRMVFVPLRDKIEIIEIIAIGRREDFEVYRIAARRFNSKQRKRKFPNRLELFERFFDNDNKL